MRHPNLILLLLIGIVSVMWMGNRTLSADFTLPPQGEIDKWIVERENLLKSGPTRVESVTVDRIEHGTLLQSRGGEIKGTDTIPIGTTLYPLRIHFMCALRAVEGYAPGMSPVTIDQYFYQDPFGEWVSFTVKSENGEFVQTGPAPSRSGPSGVSQYEGPSAEDKASRERILGRMKELSAPASVRTPYVPVPEGKREKTSPLTATPPLPQAATPISGTPHGRYEKAVQDAVGERWNYYIKVRGDGIKIGSAKIRFYVYPDGKVGDFSVIQNSSNETLASTSLQSIKEANIPPAPEGLMAPGGRMEFTMNFNFAY